VNSITAAFGCCGLENTSNKVLKGLGSGSKVGLRPIYGTRIVLLGTPNFCPETPEISDQVNRSSVIHRQNSFIPISEIASIWMKSGEFHRNWSSYL